MTVFGRAGRPVKLSVCVRVCLWLSNKNSVSSVTRAQRVVKYFRINHRDVSREAGDKFSPGRSPGEMLTMSVCVCVCLWLIKTKWI